MSRRRRAACKKTAGSGARRVGSPSPTTRRHRIAAPPTSGGVPSGRTIRGAGRSKADGPTHRSTVRGRTGAVGRPRNRVAAPKPERESLIGQDVRIGQGLPWRQCRAEVGDASAGLPDERLGVASLAQGDQPEAHDGRPADQPPGQTATADTPPVRGGAVPRPVRRRPPAEPLGTRGDSLRARASGSFRRARPSSELYAGGLAAQARQLGQVRLQAIDTGQVHRPPRLEPENARTSPRSSPASGRTSNRRAPLAS